MFGNKRYIPGLMKDVPLDVKQNTIYQFIQKLQKCLKHFVLTTRQSEW